MQPLISVQNLSVSFRMSKTETVEAVRGVSFDIVVVETYEHFHVVMGTL